ncbi:fatty acid-binding protein, liver [Pangasianodon hypophthalmus]|uniref:fatty acid-binding protein, liver n=1 Tax=Pangasianodon hypophthalmus TaxID=310915 RepID=UPI0014816660|nr:fatty acid-binding protein, liver [Pangasianodon hypophthalmus]
MAVDFSGTWQMYEQGDPEEFLEAVSVPHLIGKIMREVKPLMIIKQTGDDFVISIKTPLRTNTNSFTIGKESEFTTMDGVKTRATAQRVDGKIIIDTEKVTHMREIQGEEMVETLRAGSATLVRRYRRT